MSSTTETCQRCGGGGEFNRHLSGCANACNANRGGLGGACTETLWHHGDHSFALPLRPGSVQVISWPRGGDGATPAVVQVRAAEAREQAARPRPTLGAIPRFVHEERRMWHLSNAVDRWAGERENGEPPGWRTSPQVFLRWLEEMRDLAERAATNLEVDGNGRGADG